MPAMRAPAPTALALSLSLALLVGAARAQESCSADGGAECSAPRAASPEAGGVVLLQRVSAVSTAYQSAAKLAAGEDCHTASQDDADSSCYDNVKWAMEQGIHAHGEWYPNLNAQSAFEDFQQHMYDFSHHGCGAPCRSATPATCHDAQPHEACYEAVTWAKDQGLRGHADWYPGLSAGSSFADFQELFARGGHGASHDGEAGYAGCQMPCTQSDQGGSAAAPSPPPSPQAPAGPPAVPGESTRFLSWNIYYKELGTDHRINGIAEGIKQVAPEIVSLQEMWHEKPRILARLRESTGQDWLFAEGGETERVWDGDVLYRNDLWEHQESGVHFYGDHWVPYEGRGITWAALRRRSDGKGVLVVATHPWCCTDDEPVLQAMELVERELTQTQEQYPYPVALMGDMNAHYGSPSQQLLREGGVRAHNQDWSVPVTFTDSYADQHPRDPNPSTGFGVKIDFVYFQKTPLNMGTVTDAKVWPNLPGGSDHFAVSGDVVLH